MKVVFKGSPETIRRDMREWLLLTDIKIPSVPSPTVNPAADLPGELVPVTVAPPTIGPLAIIPPVGHGGAAGTGGGGAATFTGQDVPNNVQIEPAGGAPGEAPAPSGANVCPFCGKSGRGSKRISGLHINYCKANPNRKTHHATGKVNQGLAKYMESRRALKDPKNSAPTTSPGFPNSWPSETDSLQTHTESPINENSTKSIPRIPSGDPDDPEAIF